MTDFTFLNTLQAHSVSLTNRALSSSSSCSTSPSDCPSGTCFSDCSCTVCYQMSAITKIIIGVVCGVIGLKLLILLIYWLTQRGKTKKRARIQEVHTDGVIVGRDINVQPQQQSYNYNTPYYSVQPNAGPQNYNYSSINPPEGYIDTMRQQAPNVYPNGYFQNYPQPYQANDVYSRPGLQPQDQIAPNYPIYQ